MDFRQITQPNGGRPVAQAPVASASDGREEKKSGAKRERRNWMQLFSGILLVGVAVLLVGIAFTFTRGSNNVNNEFKFVNTSRYQAVFLNNGQVYFGNINSLNKDYLRLTHVYYLTQSDSGSSSSSSNNGNYSLVKLGCQQIHDPADEMLINRAQVSFWENLQDNGKVVSSIKQFQKQNPNGPDCSQVSNQTQAGSSNTQGGNTGTNTTK